MAQIRQEINILDQAITIAILNSSGSSEIVQLDTTQYNGTVTYYFEVEVTSAGGTVDIQLRRSGTLTDDATVTFTSSDSSPTLRRSSSFSPPAGQTEYIVHASAVQAGSVKSARIIIIQNATTLTNTETQIEICGKGASTTTSLTSVAVTNPKYWKYVSANWDGTLTVYFEATIKNATSKSTTTASLQVADGTGDGFANFADVTSSPVTVTGTTVTRVRSPAITLTAGRWYRAAFKTDSTKEAATIYNAKVIVDQADGSNMQASGGTGPAQVSIRGGTGATSFQAEAQSFKIQTTSTITGVKLKLSKVGSPVDTLNVDIVSSLGGSSLANATKLGTDLTTSYVEYTLTFGSPVALTGGSTYYIQLTRSPDTADATNYYNWDGSAPGVEGYGDGVGQERDSNSWAPGSVDKYFVLIGQAGFTKLEPQYLLANTLFAAGTGLQTFLTKWDSTEWDAGSGTITYNSQAEAANGSTSDVTIEEADGGGTVTNSTLTDIDNAQISSSSLTMPADQNLDTKATTNAGDVAAARILVTYAFAASAGIPQNVPYTNPNLKALSLMGVGI